MGAVDYLFDSNVLINVLNVYREDATAILRSTPRRHRAISIITWIEVLAGTIRVDQLETEAFVSDFKVIDVTAEIATRAVAIRREMRLKLPDAIIYATALTTGRTLVTFNSRDFPANTPSVHLLS